jgi:hypothetical protein
MKKASLLLVVLLTLAFSLPVTLQAQSDELTQTYTSQDGQLVLQYPAGWIVALSDTLLLANNASALAGTLGVTEMADGDVAFTFLTPDILAQLELTSTEPVSLLNEFISMAELTGAARPYTGVTLPAADAIFTDIPDVGNGQIVALQFDAGIVVVVVEFGGLPSASADLVAEILSGIRYSDQAATDPTATVTGDTLRQWASAASGTSQYGSSSWSFAQATGAPDTANCGDETTAWASSTSTGQDTLVLDFTDAVIPSQINIYQTYNPGSIIRVAVGDAATNTLVDLPNSTDPLGNTPCPGVFTLDVSGITTPVNRVSIDFDQTIGGSWNEIDAVELVGVPVGAAPVEDVTMDILNFNGRFSISYPSTWVNDVSGSGPLVASVPEALDLTNTDSMPAGAIRIEFALPDEIEQQGIPTDTPIEEVMNAVLTAFESTAPVLPLDGANRAAFIAQVVGPDVPSGAILIGVQMPTGPVLAAVRTEDYPRYEAVVLQIINSIAMK